MTALRTGESIPIVEARRMLTKLPELLEKDKRTIAVTRRGTPVMALMSWEMFEAIEETLDIMGDPELMEALRQSIKDVEGGKLIRLENIKARFTEEELREAEA